MASTPREGNHGVGKTRMVGHGQYRVQEVARIARVAVFSVKRVDLKLCGGRAGQREQGRGSTCWGQDECCWTVGSWALLYLAQRLYCELQILAGTLAAGVRAGSHSLEHHLALPGVVGE